MDNSIYVALSKQSAAETQMDAIANNIANANTSGYKSEDLAFTTYLHKSGKGEISFAKQAGMVRNNSQGTLETTGNPLDLAIQGEGYFGVKTPQGERYTRAGNFTLNDQGELVNSDGYKVVDQAGQSLQFQPEDRQIKVYSNGRVEVDGEERSTIGIYKLNPNSLTKEGSNLYSSSETATTTDESRIAQGMLENSNVNPIVEMTKMLSVQRDYERTSKFINSIYDLQENAIRTLGRSG